MGDLSITALYTSAVWSWGRLPGAALLATPDAARVFAVTNAALALAGPAGAPLRYALLHRHAMIDHLARAARPRRILEVAAGLSRRGVALSADPAVAYTELDLPAMIEQKRALLARTSAGRAVLARGNFHLVAGDVATDPLPAADLVIAEGLAMYLDARARARLFAQVAAQPDATLVFDLVPADEEPAPGRAGRLLEAAMKRFTGGQAFERDARTRAQILAELAAAGLVDATAHAAIDVAAAWRLPHPERATPTVVFTARAPGTRG